MRSRDCVFRRGARCVIVTACLAVALFMIGEHPVHAGVPVLLDFENFPAGTAIFNQYDGVTFVGGDRLNLDGSHPITIAKPAQGTVSPTLALRSAAQQHACELCGTQLILLFDEAQHRVSLSAGLAQNYSSGVTLLLQGFDSDPTVAGATPITQSVLPCLGTSVTAINTPLEINDGAARILYAVLSPVDCARPDNRFSGPDNGVVILDNLLYDRPLNPPPRESDPPVIRITSPAPGSAVIGSVPGETRLTIEATVTETAILGMTAQVNGHPPVPVYFRRTSPQSYNADVEVAGGDGLVNGNNTVVLAAVDFDRPQNQGTASVSFTYQIRAYPPLDIVPTAVEVTQSIDGGPRALTSIDASQHVDGYELLIQNSPPLLKGKATMVRIYAAATGTANPVRNVPAVMSVFHDFCSSNCLVAGGLPPFAFTNIPLFQGITVPVAGTPDSVPGIAAASLSKSWNFLLPADWTTGPLVLDITINSGTYNNFPHRPPVFECESGAALSCVHNNQLRLHVQFQDGPQITVHPVIIHVTGTYNGDTFSDVKPKDAQVEEIFTQLNQLYPAVVTRGAIFDRTVAANISKDDFVDMMSDFDSNDGRELFIGIFPGDQGPFKANEGDIPGSIVAGAGIAGGRGAWANADDPIDVAHELGHNIGFDHWGCENGVDDDECGVFPIPHAGIGGFGIDIANWTVIPPGDNSRNDTPHAHDFMSYGQLCELPDFGGGSGCDTGEWVSWYTYDILLNHPAIDSYDTDDPPALLFRGRIGADGSASLMPVYLTAVNHRLGSRVPEDDVETIYTIQGYDRSGNTILLHNFEPKKVAIHGSPRTFVFNEAVTPPRSSLTKVSVFHGSQLIGEVKHRDLGGDPGVAITAPVEGARWPAAKPQTIEWQTTPARFKLPALVQYSSDGGATRITLAHDVIGTQLTVNPDELPGSNEAIVYVQVSDGLNSAAAEAGPFLVAKKHPTVKIVRPATGDQVLANVPLTLEGTGFDRQETLTEDQFQWSSSLDGPLGTGRVLTVSTLTIGTHTLSLSATDSAGLAGEDAVDIKITETVVGPEFHRGDANGDGKADISDAITTLGFLFLGDVTLSCKESADVNNDGKIDISDGIYLLSWLFTGGPEPAAPGPTGVPCGFDPDPPGSPGDLGCENYSRCQ